MGADVVRTFLHRLVESTDFRITDIARMNQPRIAHHPTEDFVDFFVFDNGPGERCAIQRRKPAFVGFGEGFGIGFRAGKVRREFGRILPGIQVIEVPFGKRAEGRAGTHDFSSIASSDIWCLTAPGKPETDIAGSEA